MKHRRSAAVFLAVLLTLMSVPFAAFAESGVVFTFSCSVPENRQPELGDTVTYTVGISQNSGFCAGTFFFKPSDNLTYVPGSAVLLGNLQEDRVAEGENAGAYGLIYLEKSDYTSKSDSFCSVSFIVSGLGDISVEFYAYQLMNSKLADVPYTVTPGKSLTDTVKTPEKPVIKTESLPDGILNMQYDFMIEADRDDFLSWEVTSGALPEGIALSDEGMLSGIPTESGSFTFGVRAALTAGNIVSDEKQFTLTVLEAPKKLTPTKSSSYTVSGGYVTKVIAETKLSDFVGNFETPEYVKVFGSDGKEITDKNAYVGTGCRVSLMNGDNAVDSADVVVLGDISGDGRLTSVDYLRLRAYFGGDYELSGAYLAAAHIAGRDTVTSVDYLRLRAHFSGDYNIYN
ncbi:putative S-layer homology domain protein [Candidatus Colimorpha enterica]|uniref:Putative S-layer homology domain protein n=1 Tax=Candidatus Colimorpha enterica TaxID=3083063 RepID=R6TLZ2_9BACT|nr:putative S-layer homology domain protein [Candidatus Colimorpha enterica]